MIPAGHSFGCTCADCCRAVHFAAINREPPTPEERHSDADCEEIHERIADRKRKQLYTASNGTAPIAESRLMSGSLSPNNQ